MFEEDIIRAEALRRSVGLAASALAAAGLFAIASAGGAAPPPSPEADAPHVASVERALPTPRPKPASTGAVWFHGSDDNDTLDGSEDADLVHAYAGDDVLHGYGGDDWLEGFAGDDLVIGGTGHDHLAGDQGDDRLVGGSGDDTLEGGSGNDRLQGGPGSDRYVFGSDFGRDVVAERGRGGGLDRLVLTHHRLDQVEVLQQADDLVLRTGGRDEVRVLGHFADPERRVEILELADGREVDLRASGERPRHLTLAAR